MTGNPIVREPLVGSPWSWGRDFAVGSVAAASALEAPNLAWMWVGHGGPPLLPVGLVALAVAGGAFVAGSLLASVMESWRRSVPLALWLALGAVLAAVGGEALAVLLGGSPGETLFLEVLGFVGGGAAFVAYLVARVTRGPRWPALLLLVSAFSAPAVLSLPAWVALSAVAG